LTTDANSGAEISVTASDSSWINSTAGAVALGIAFGQSTAVAAALGFSLTINDIHNTTRAAVEDSALASDGTVTVSADSTASIENVSSVLTGGGDVIVSASDSAKIDVVSIAAALAVAVGGGTSVGVAGGASESTNIIHSLTNASIENSTLGSALDKVGKVD